MQIHGPSQTVDEINVHRNGGFAVIELGSVSVFVQTPAECDKIIKAGALAKSLLPGAPPGLDARLSPPGYSLPAIELATDAEDEPRCEADFSGAGSPQCLKARDHQGPHMDETGRRWVFGAGTDAP